MPYLPNIPQPGDTLSASQPRILGNFQEIETDFARNHVALTDATVANRGKHKFVTYSRQAADPVIIATEGESFTKAVAGTTQLFWKRFGGAAVQMTGVDPVSAANGYTFLPGNLMLQWGTFFVDAGNDIIPFTTNFGGAPYSISLQYLRSTGAGNTSIYVRDDAGHAPNFAQFETYSTATGHHDLYWIAIGPG